MIGFKSLFVIFGATLFVAGEEAKMPQISSPTSNMAYNKEELRTAIHQSLSRLRGQMQKSHNNDGVDETIEGQFGNPVTSLLNLAANQSAVFDNVIHNFLSSLNTPAPGSSTSMPGLPSIVPSVETISAQVSVFLAFSVTSDLLAAIVGADSLLPAVVEAILQLLGDTLATVGEGIQEPLQLAAAVLDSLAQNLANNTVPVTP